MTHTQTHLMCHHTHTHTRVCPGVSSRGLGHVTKHVYSNIHVCVCVCVYVRAYVYGYTQVSAPEGWDPSYTHTHTHTHVCTYDYMQVSAPEGWDPSYTLNWSSRGIGARKLPSLNETLQCNAEYLTALQLSGANTAAHRQHTLARAGL